MSEKHTFDEAAGHLEDIEAQLETTGWLTGKEAQMLMVLARPAPALLEACKALREAALNLRGEVIVTGELTAKTLEPMFAADDLAQAAIAKATKGT